MLTLGICLEVLYLGIKSAYELYYLAVVNCQLIIYTLSTHFLF